MEELRLYDVTVGRNKTRMRLNASDAAAMGDAAVPVGQPESARPVPGKARVAVANKMRDAGESAARDVTER